MKKKILIWMSSIVGLIALTVGVTYGMIYVADNPVNKKASTEVDTSQYKTVPREKESMTGQIDGVVMNLPVTESSNEDGVIKAMHHMTHQKVVATQKWGTIPMSKENTEKIRDILNNSNFEKKEELLAIAERWINRDFSKIVEDHNYFWTTQEGNVGKATGVMDAVAEQTFVLNNFGEEITQELFKQGDLKEIK
ncbi:PRK06770 family protein [Bacillus toyonensis]|uniref:PRK06770 family protein n=1 Tax=Bacillus toyonensis TaxID=155322 RepID=UPI00381D13DE